MQLENLHAAAMRASWVLVMLAPVFPETVKTIESSIAETRKRDMWFSCRKRVYRSVEEAYPVHRSTTYQQHHRYYCLALMIGTYVGISLSRALFQRLATVFQVSLACLPVSHLCHGACPKDRTSRDDHKKTLLA